MNGATREKKALSIEEVLADEVEAIHDEKLMVEAHDQNAQEKRTRLNEDQRKLSDRNAVKPRDEFYRALNKLNRAALCCSGGGIRSATFCLGVIQAFANYDVNKKPPAPRSSAEPKPAESEAIGHQSAEITPSKPARTELINAMNSALGRFHYLSTVSGGGYVGSWLSSWRKCSDFETLIQNLTGRPNGADIEPPELSWLRAYSNYLTPRLGVASADSWAAVAICVRNLMLNWLVIIPIVCLVLLTLKLIATASVWVAHNVDEPKIMIGFLIFGVIFLIIAQVFTNLQRPSRRTDRGNARDWTFVFGDLIWALLSAICLTIFFSSHYFDTQLKLANGSAGAKLELLVVAAVAGLLVYLIGWMAALRFSKWNDFICWALSGLVYGALVGLGAYLFSWLEPYPTTSDKLLVLLLAVTFGVPWILASRLIAEIVFVGLASYEENSDADREWLGRAGGWVAAAAVAWALIAFLVFDGGYFVQSAAVRAHQAIVTSGGIVGILSGITTALLGSSPKTPAKSSRKDQSNWTAIAYNTGLAVAGPLFVTILVIALSVALDQLLLGDSLVDIYMKSQSTRTTLTWLAIGFGIVIIVGGLASYFVNINRFSLHALYRNRLIRCYLGASNEQRDPDPFSGFDFKDNVCVHELWPPKSGGKTNPYSLFHVINIALNVVSTKRLAWQERKAESFTVSPRHSGSAYLGFRPSEEYGDYPGKGGISLGTAMAISGAAVSPNMGYHSSPSISLLLTLFNVRLGWWLGSPGKAGEKTYQADGPKWAARPLFAEAFGQTTDNTPYVYLSDGGHFENLGLYEMVRRRCRLIVLIDAGCDGEFAFEDLGNAVRKIYIDLGIRITFKDLNKLKNRQSAKSLSRAVRDSAALASLAAAEKTAKGNKIPMPDETPYHAIGTIHYKDADCTKADDGSGPAENGYILYIKPAYHGTEISAGIRSYATANPEFPHETTLDQWFTESQFESYRSLGLDIANDILRYEVMLCPEKKLSLHDALKALKVQNNSFSA